MTKTESVALRAYLSLGLDPDLLLDPIVFERCHETVARLIAARLDVADVARHGDDHTARSALRHLAQSLMCIHEEEPLW